VRPDISFPTEGPTRTYRDASSASAVLNGVGRLDRPDRLDDETAQRVIDLFRTDGVSMGISVASTAGGDEAIFVVDRSAAATMSEAALTAAE
jgi:hypothetical protein